MVSIFAQRLGILVVEMRGMLSGCQHDIGVATEIW